ncbi:MAG: MCE family protein [Nocardioidaceae bacterium]|nr:MCE family protein [Nocardioidaceae bacterium]MCL2612446.1 MCE family protein [Nocardioidaceae bacterium]
MTRPSPYVDEAPGGGLLATLYTRRWLSALGVLAIVLVLALLATCVAVFTHAFDDPAHVRLDVDRAGSQLSTGADVKLDGVIVGRVASIRATGHGRGAVLSLAIDRDRLSLIPANVTAQILPKTIFGEKYVDLTLPAEPSPARLADGAVLHRDRTSEAIETRTVLDDLEPLLTAISPADLETTLSNVATAVRGRGRLIGDTLADSARFAHELRPAIPLVVGDAGLVGRVSDSYRRAAGPLLSSLVSFDVTARTLTRRQRQLRALLASSGRFADLARGFVDRVGPDAVEVVAVSRPLLQMLSHYAPELACTIRGITLATDRLEAVFDDGPYLKARLFVSVSRGAYKPGVDAPKDLDLSAYGPYCPVIPKNGKGTVPWPPVPKELDSLRGLDQETPINSLDGLPGHPATGTNPLVGLLMGGPLG